LATTWDGILLWAIEIRIKIHLVTNSNWNTTKKLQEMTNNVGLTISVGDTTPQFTNSIEQDN
jgi:hypothetical protein